MTLLPVLNRPLRWIARTGAALLTVVVAYVLLAMHPEPAFAYRTSYQNFAVHSDRPIPASITTVLDDATRSWKTSTLYDSHTRIQIFFCHAPWRLWLYGGRFDTSVGGVAGGIVVDNVFIRASDIDANRIHAPGGGPIADAEVRPLSYFIAHEITHADTVRRYGHLAALQAPQWLMEGYADYVGKGGQFDFDDNQRRFLAGDATLRFRGSGLYREFHLKTAWLLDKQGWTLDRMFTEPPTEAQLERWLRDDGARKTLTMNSEATP